MDVQAYLNRIAYQGPLNDDLETLQHLQFAHLLSVPFENLSIHAGEPIVLDEDALFRKIVVRRRGGFCYELNGLFAWLLRRLGFKVAMLSAQVASPNGEFGPDFDHMTLMIVQESRRWLVDVGFGDSFIEPLSLDSNTEYRQRECFYRIVAGPDRSFVLEQRGRENEWRPQYRFTHEPHHFSDYEEMCRYHQTSPESHFTQQKICWRLTPSGRISLTDDRFIITDNGVRTERLVTSKAEYSETLRDEFGIVI